MVLTAVAVSRGFGRPVSAISAANIDAKLVGISTFIASIFGPWASTFARLSIAHLLLQVPQQKASRVVLWSIIVFNMAMLVGANVVQHFQCRPIRARWDYVDDAKYFHPEVVRNLDSAFVAAGMINDAIFAILPSVLIWRLSRDRVEKLLLSLLMGLGLGAVATGIPRIVTIQSYDAGSDEVLAAVLDMAMPNYLW